MRERKYHIGVREVHVSTMLVHATSKEDAIRKVKDGEGEEVLLEYSHTLDPDIWTVEPASQDRKI